MKAVTLRIETVKKSNTHALRQKFHHLDFIFASHGNLFKFMITSRTDTSKKSNNALSLYYRHLYVILLHVEMIEKLETIDKLTLYPPWNDMPNTQTR